MMIPKSFIEELNDTVPVSKVVGRYVTLKRKGKEQWGLCPFHGERTPSFSVNDDKGFYHCFSCGAHGNALNFIIQHNNLEFIDAVKELAQIAGREIPQPDAAETQKYQERNTLYDLMNEVAKSYQQNLYSQAGKQALEYCYNRGLTDETIKHFNLGWSLDNDSLIRFLKSKNYTDEQMIKVGVLAESYKDKKRLYQRFRNRIMFPIFDLKNNVIAFGGRSIDDEIQPKYMNSADTALFNKGFTLYNLQNAKQTTNKSKRLYICEGYMDVIALKQAGINEAVAPLGTALTENQIDMMWRYVNEPTLCFDGDEAGLKAIFRASRLMLAKSDAEHNGQVLILPNQEDPDSFIQKYGVEKFNELANRTPKLFDFVFNYVTKDKNLSDPNSRAKAEHELMEIASTIENTIINAHYKSAFRNKLWQTIKEHNNQNAIYNKGARGRQGQRNATGQRLRSSNNTANQLNQKTADQYGVHYHDYVTMMIYLIKQPKIIIDLEEPIMQITLPENLRDLKNALFDWLVDQVGNNDDSTTNTANLIKHLQNYDLNLPHIIVKNSQDQSIVISYDEAKSHVLRLVSKQQLYEIDMEINVLKNKPDKTSADLQKIMELAKHKQQLL